MTHHHAAIRRWSPLLGGLCSVPLTAALGWAAEGEQTWRATYDVVMMWANFGILAFLLVKYARAPLINLLQGEVKKTAKTIDEVEERKRQVVQELQDTANALENSRERLRSVKERIIREGEQKKQEIIESAQRESQIMLNQTRVRIEHQIAEVQDRLKAELIDRAVEAALERLPRLVTADDHKRLVEKFIRET